MTTIHIPPIPRAEQARSKWRRKAKRYELLAQNAWYELQATIEKIRETDRLAIVKYLPSRFNKSREGVGGNYIYRAFVKTSCDVNSNLAHRSSYHRAAFGSGFGDGITVHEIDVNGHWII